MYNKNTKKALLNNFGLTVKQILWKISFFVLLCVIFPNSIKAQPVAVWDNLKADVLGGTGSSSDNDMMGQQFILTAPNVKITEIKLPMTNNAPNIDGNFTISIYNDNAGKLGTKVADLYTGTNASINLLPTWVTVDNSTAPTTMPKLLSAGTFWVVVSGSGIGMSGQYTQWYYDMTDGDLTTGTTKRNCVYVTTPTEQYFDVQPYFMKLTAGPCSAPTAAASSVTFGASTATTIKFTGFTAPSGGAEGYSIYINSANSFTAPNDGAVLTANLAYSGGQQCIYTGAGIPNNLDITGLTLNTTYYFKVYSYNDCTGTKYETTGAGASKATASPPAVTSATYNASTGALVLTCTDIYTNDNIVISNLTVTGDNNATYQLTTNNVSATNSTTVSATLNATDRNALAPLFNKNGTTSTRNTTYNISAAAGWNATVSSSLDGSNGVTVSGVTSPAVSSVSVPANNTYKINDNMDFTVNFAENITVNTGSGTPTIPITLNTGGVVNAAYVSGTGTQNIVFRYQVASGNLDSDGITVGAAIALNNGTMRNGNGTDINTTLNNIAVATGVKVDGEAPSLISVTPPSNGIYTTIQNLIFTIKFSEAVTVTNLGNIPYISLRIGANTRSALYTAGSGTTDLSFYYQVEPDDIDNDGIGLLANIKLDNSSITDAAGNPAALVFASSALNSVYVNIVKATITTDAAGSVSGSSASLGGTITANGGAAVTERGIVYSSLNNTPTIGGANVTKKVNASGLDAFSEVINTFSPNTTYYFQAYATNLAGTQYGGVQSFTTQAGVTSVSVPADLTYKSGDDLNFTVNFSANITVDITNGRPYFPITLNTGGNVNAVYSSGSGTQNLVFTYTIAPGNEDNDGITVGASIALNNGTMKGPGNVDATLTLNNVGVTTGVKVDAKAPTVSSTTAQANGTYVTNQDLTASIVFDEAVTVTGTPTISMTIGSSTVTAGYSTGTGTATLVFKHKILAGEIDDNGILVGDNLTVNGSSISLNTGTIKDAAGNNAVLTFTGFSETEVLVNVSTPTVTTQAASVITSTTATGNGNVTGLGAPNPTQHGVVWSKLTNPTIALLTKTTDGAVAATGAFTSSITGLDPYTTYYLKAYATNSIGTSYGDEVSFLTDGIKPTVTTQAVSSIGSSTATGNGNITNLGTPNPTQYGVTWDTNHNPDVTLLTKTTQGATASTGAFTSNITGLAPNTLYYVRAYATNVAGTSYGDEVSFTTRGLVPTVTTQPVTDITATTATANGNITNLGVPNPTQHGVVWSAAANPTIDLLTKTTKGAAMATGAFTSAITDLSASTTYYVKAYATNNEGTSYGAEETFTTSAVPPLIQAKEIVFSNITTTGMTISWTNGNGAKRVVFVKETTGVITNPVENTTYTASSDWSIKGSQAGASGYFCVYNGNQNTITLTGLTNNTQYSVQVFEYNGPALGEKYLTTTALNNPANKTTVTNPPVATAATLVASLSFTSNWNTIAGATGFRLDVARDDLFTLFVTGYNNLSIGDVTNYDVTGLSGATQYFYRVRAVNSGGVSASSNVISITTNQVIKSKDTVITPSGFTVKWDPVINAITYFLDYSSENVFTSAPAAKTPVENYSNSAATEAENPSEGNQSLAKTTVNYTTINVGNVTDYTLGGLNPATRYYYRVRAANIIGEIISQSTVQNILTASSPSTSGSFVITTPTPHVKWQAGSVKFIEWRRTNGLVYGSQSLEYSTNGGLNWDAITKQPIAGAMRYQWIVPDVESDNCLIRICNYITKKVICVTPITFEIFRTASRVNNFPNPFNPSTIIQFKMEKSGPVMLKVYNSIGQEVALLINRELEAGLHEYEFNASNLTSGIYFYTIQFNGVTETRKMLLIK